MFERFSRSWGLVKASADVLRQDKELLVFPLLSSLAAIVLICSYMFPAWQLGWFAEIDRTGEPPPVMIVASFLFYLLMYFIGFFFSTALVGAAMIRLEGGDPTVADGLRIASSKVGTILAYAAIAATVGLILRIIEERAGAIGTWVARILGAGWAIATFLVVPVLVSRDIGPIDAVKHSASLLKKTWGENIIGNVGIGAVFFLLYLALFFGGGALMVVAVKAQSGALMLGLGGLLVLAFILMVLIQSALQGVYAAAVYRYAETGNAGGAFNPQTLDGAFKQKG